MVLICFLSSVSTFSSFGGRVNTSDAPLSALKISKGTGCFICLGNASWKLQSSGIQRCAVVFDKSQKPVKKSSHTSRCIFGLISLSWMLLAEFQSSEQCERRGDSANSVLKWVWWYYMFPVVDCDIAHFPIAEWPNVVCGLKKLGDAQFLHVQA